MKKIAYVIPNFPKLSETFVFREVQTVRDLGVDAQVFASVEPSVEDVKKLPKVIKQLKDNTTYLERNEALLALVKYPILAFKYFNFSKVLAKEATNPPNQLVLLGRGILLAKKLKEGKFEHIHAHWPYATILAYLAKEITGLPMSVSIHAHEVAHEGGHFDRVFPKMEFAAFCNRAAMELLLSKTPKNLHDKAHLIYHGVNISEFPFLPMKSIEKTINIVTAGRLTATKGFDRLIKACALAKERGIAIKLTILGRGSLEKELQDLAKKLNFEENLVMPGWIAHQEVSAYIEDAHIFALLANVNYHDGLPNVVLEAMAMGRPGILSPLPAGKEAIEQGINGFILENEFDYEGFVKILLEINEDRTSIERLGKAARSTVEEKFADTIHIGRMVRMF